MVTKRDEIERISLMYDGLRDSDESRSHSLPCITPKNSRHSCSRLFLGGFFFIVEKGMYRTMSFFLLYL